MLEVTLLPPLRLCLFSDGALGNVWGVEHVSTRKKLPTVPFFLLPDEGASVLVAVGSL